MGGAASTGGVAQAFTGDAHLKHLMRTADLSMQSQIEHYQPPSFPIVPIVTNKTVDVCRDTWNTIRTQERKGVSGVVYFYDEFYKRLFDRSEAFNSFFSGDMKKKGQVLIRIMEFLTTIDMDHTDLFFMKVEGLAKIHSKRTIRPWMYSCFIETLTTTVSSCLEEKATYEAATAWTHLGAYALRALLPGAIKDSIVTTESNQNSFSGDLDEDQILELESQDDNQGFSARSSGRGKRSQSIMGSARSSARGSARGSARDNVMDGLAEHPVPL